MLFYDSPNPAPNPRRVRIFAAEKGISLPSKQISITAALPGRNAEWGEANRPRVADAFAFFDRSLENSEFLAGERFSMADIVLLTTVDFARFVGCGPGPENAALLRWHETVSGRPSASA